MLADTLRSRHDAGCTFYLFQDEVGEQMVREHGWPVVRLPGDGSDGVPGGDQLLVVDLPGGVTRDYVRARRGTDPERLLALFDGSCAGRLDADLVVTPLERLPNPKDWTGFRGRRFEGLAYAILDPAYAVLPRRVIEASRGQRLLVAMGGADPLGLTLKALQALDPMADEFETTVALGPAFSDGPAINAFLAGARRTYAIQREPSLAPLAVAADLAVTSFGTSAYELAAAGLPAVAISITPDHVEAAELMARMGILVNAGLYSTVSAEQLANMVHELLADTDRRTAMARAGQALVDGHGAERVADLLVAAIDESVR